MREYKGYKEIFDEYQLLKEGDSLLHLSLCLSYEWDESEEELELISQNCLAEKRGVIIKRIILVDKENEERIRNSILLKNYLKNKLSSTKVYLVKTGDIIEICKEDYKNIGDGYGIFNNEKAFIDSYRNNESIGYMLRGENIIEPLIKSFYNIFQKIEDGEIKQFEIFKG